MSSLTHIRAVYQVTGCATESSKIVARGHIFKIMKLRGAMQDNPVPVAIEDLTPGDCICLRDTGGVCAEFLRTEEV